MANVKKMFVIMSTIVMVVCTMFGMAIPAAAATSSYRTTTQTITVQTGSNWWYPGSESITLSQSMGTRKCSKYNWWTRKTTTKETKCYGTWIVNVRSSDGKHTINKKLTSRSLKINLKSNKTYKITVSWDGMQDTINAMSKGSFSNYPTWRVSGTHKIKSYK